MLFLITDHSSSYEWQSKNGDTGVWSVTDSVSWISDDKSKTKEKGDNGSA